MLNLKKTDGHSNEKCLEGYINIHTLLLSICRCPFGGSSEFYPWKTWFSWGLRCSQWYPESYVDYPPTTWSSYVTTLGKYAFTKYTWKKFRIDSSFTVYQCILCTCWKFLILNPHTLRWFTCWLCMFEVWLNSILFLKLYFYLYYD